MSTSYISNSAQCTVCTFTFTWCFFNGLASLTFCFGSSPAAATAAWQIVNPSKPWAMGDPFRFPNPSLLSIFFPIQNKKITHDDSNVNILHFQLCTLHTALHSLHIIHIVHKFTWCVFKALPHWTSVSVHHQPPPQPPQPDTDRLSIHQSHGPWVIHSDFTIPLYCSSSSNYNFKKKLTHDMTTDNVNIRHFQLCTLHCTVCTLFTLFTSSHDVFSMALPHWPSVSVHHQPPQPPQPDRLSIHQSHGPWVIHSDFTIPLYCPSSSNFKKTHTWHDNRQCQHPTFPHCTVCTWFTLFTSSHDVFSMALPHWPSVSVHHQPPQPLQPDRLSTHQSHGPWVIHSDFTIPLYCPSSSQFKTKNHTRRLQCQHPTFPTLHTALHSLHIIHIVHKFTWCVFKALPHWTSVSVHHQQPPC